MNRKSSDKILLSSLKSALERVNILRQKQGNLNIPGQINNFLADSSWEVSREVLLSLRPQIATEGLVVAYRGNEPSRFDEGEFMREDELVFFPRDEDRFVIRGVWYHAYCSRTSGWRYERDRPSGVIEWSEYFKSRTLVSMLKEKNLRTWPSIGWRGLPNISDLKWYARSKKHITPEMFLPELIRVISEVCK